MIGKKSQAYNRNTINNLRPKLLPGKLHNELLIEYNIQKEI
jgi:hypothetical protein